jgi:predicted nucleic acid-binding protein
MLAARACLARAARLGAYDAVYAALALHRGASLLTLDLELRANLSEVFPQLTFAVPPAE